MPISRQHRTKIKVIDGKVMHNDEEARIIFTKDTIKIGCVDTNAETLTFLIGHYNTYLESEGVCIFQDGEKK